MQARKKEIGLITLITLVCGNMVGSGIFLLPSSLAGIGAISLVSWVFTGIGAICLALVFAHISRIIPKSGGPYSYARAAFGDYLGFQTAYNYWFAIWIGNAAIALALVGYSRVFFPILDDPWNTFFAAAGVVWLLTAINIFGVRTAGLVQAITTLLKLIPILLIGLVGWFYVDKNNFIAYANISHPHLSTFSALSSGAALTFWAFIGLESATVPEAAVKNPERNIPLATLIGTVLAAIVYILSSSAIMGMIPASQLQHSVSPFAQAAKIIFGAWGEYLIAAGAVISCFGALNGWILLQGQVAMAAADDQLFPSLFSKRNKRHVPAEGMVITSLLITLLLLLTASNNLVEQFNIIILLAVITNVIPYLYTTIADLLCIQEGNGPTYKKIMLMCVATIACIFSFWAIFSSGFRTVYYGSILLLTSVPVYAWMVRKNIKIIKT